MPVAALTPSAALPLTARKSSLVPEKKYKCQFCNRAFSRSEHRSRHERSHTKERPFKCLKCRSTFVRRDLLLRHDRTVHAKDGGIPLHSDVKRRKQSAKSNLSLDPSALEQIEASSDGMVDLETAAMLMTDLHHKATAAIRSAAIGSCENDEPEMAFPPRSLTLMDPSVTYTSGVVSLPPVQWDAFFTKSPRKASTRSVTSDFSIVQEPYLVSRASVLPRPHQIRSLTQDTSFSSDPLDTRSLDSARQSQPHPSRQHCSTDRGDNVVCPLDSMKRLVHFRIPQVLNDEERNLILENLREADTERAIPESFRLPALTSLNRFLSTYFGLFHHHLPFLHPSSFKATQVSPSLFLAVISIGALYDLEQDHAFMFHIGSKVLVSQFLQNKENFSSRKCPLWTMQSSLLNMIFASWSGDPKGLEWACSIKSLLANMVAGNRYELKLRCEAREAAECTYSEWIEDEGCRRTYYAVYIFFGLLTMTYNHTPAISFNEFEDLQLPSSEARWNMDIEGANGSEEAPATLSGTTFMEAHDHLFQGEPLRYSAFATRVMINALFLEVWYHKRSPEALQDVVTEYKLRLALETWEKSLEHCEPESSSMPSGASHKSHPLIFNAFAVFRNVRARLEVDLKSIQEALRYHDPYEVAAAMSNARNKVKRSSEMIKVINESFKCFQAATLQGIRWTTSISATAWSIEHPLCGLDLVVILTLWLYRVEHDEEVATEEELLMYNKIRSLFDDETVESCDAKLSSIVARTWGAMQDAVAVWGISRLMGEAFALHSQALVGYEDDIERSSSASTPSMISQGPDDVDDSVY